MKIRNYVEMATRFHHIDQPLPADVRHKLLRGEINLGAARNLSHNTRLTHEEQEALLRFEAPEVTSRVLINSTRPFIGLPVATISDCLNTDVKGALPRAVEAYVHKPRKTLLAALLDRRVLAFYNSEHAKLMLSSVTHFDTAKTAKGSTQEAFQVLTQILSYEDAHTIAEDPATTPEALSYLLSRPFSPRNAARLASRILTEADRVTDQRGFDIFTAQHEWYARTPERQTYQEMMRRKSEKEIPADEAPYFLSEKPSKWFERFDEPQHYGNWANVLTEDLEDVETFVAMYELDPGGFATKHMSNVKESWTERMVRQLHLRTDIPADLRRKGFELIEADIWGWIGAARNFAEGIDPREMFEPGSYEMEYWRKHFARELLDKGGWDIFDGPENFAQDLPAKFEILPGLLWEIAKQSPQRVVITNMPFREIENLSDRGWRHLAAQMLDEAVGDHPAAQDAIGVLISNGWDSTFGELLSTARAVSI